jgi:hypothetical protein
VAGASGAADGAPRALLFDAGGDLDARDPIRSAVPGDVAVVSAVNSAALIAESTR